MPSILVRIECSVSKHVSALVLTIVDVGFLDHTLDGILDIISFGLFNLSWLGHVSATVNNESTAYSSLSDILDFGV
jgi:hypothetical protein